MSTSLHLSLHEYNRMVDLGAFDELNRKIELIRGEIRTMSPKGPRHSSGNSRANRYFIKLLGDQTIIRIQDPIHIDAYSEPEPEHPHVDGE